MVDKEKKVAETKPAAKPKNTPKPQVKESGPVIYIGPNLRGKLAQFTVFKSDLPKHVKDLVEKEPLLKRLIVPVSKMAAGRANIAKAGTPEHQAMSKLLGKEN